MSADPTDPYFASPVPLTERRVDSATTGARPAIRPARTPSQPHLAVPPPPPQGDAAWTAYQLLQRIEQDFGSTKVQASRAQTARAAVSLLKRIESDFCHATGQPIRRSAYPTAPPSSGSEFPASATAPQQAQPSGSAWPAQQASSSAWPPSASSYPPPPPSAPPSGPPTLRSGPHPAVQEYPSMGEHDDDGVTASGVIPSAVAAAVAPPAFDPFDASSALDEADQETLDALEPAGRRLLRKLFGAFGK